MQLYPNARLLVASKDDLSRDRRKFLTAKIASGQWDGIIVTQSSFERIGMSREYQEQFLLKQIEEYDELLRQHSHDRGQSRNLIKTIEKQKAARAEKLKNLLAEDKKDDGLEYRWRVPSRDAAGSPSDPVEAGCSSPAIGSAEPELRRVRPLSPAVH
jgi:N12 class adenine-specific DNA methylase